MSKKLFRDIQFQFGNFVKSYCMNMHSSNHVDSKKCQTCIMIRFDPLFNWGLINGEGSTLPEN